MIFTENRYDRSIERMMKGVPNFYPRSSGIVVTGNFKYTAEILNRCEVSGDGSKKLFLVKFTHHPNHIRRQPFDTFFHQEAVGC